MKIGSFDVEISATYKPLPDEQDTEFFLLDLATYLRMAADKAEADSYPATARMIRRMEDDIFSHLSEIGYLDNIETEE